MWETFDRFNVADWYTFNSPQNPRAEIGQRGGELTFLNENGDTSDAHDAVHLENLAAMSARPDTWPSYSAYFGFLLDEEEQDQQGFHEIA